MDSTDVADTGPVPLRERRRRETTDQIVDVARRLFAEHGYTATRTNEIAGEAGVSDATLFRYFDSKAAIALHGVSERITLALELLAAQPAHLDPLSATRAAFAEALARDLFGLDDPVVAEVRLVIRTPELWPEFDARINKAAQRLTAVLAERARHREPTLGDRVAAHAIVGAIQAAVGMWFEDPTLAPLPDLLAQAFAELDPMS
ncbi:MAG: TetR family transcriptional regulator [Acidimicrobiales bacterium]|nr:TetR family transcriptional regulator [Acidimicrobiales bacterium]